jgi:hypothetical protein
MSRAPDSRFQRRKAIATFLRKFNMVDTFGLEARPSVRSTSSTGNNLSPPLASAVPAIELHGPALEVGMH